MTPEERREFLRAAGRKGGKARFALMTPEERLAFQRAGAEASLAARRKRTEAMIGAVLRDRLARGIIDAVPKEYSIPPPTEEQRLTDGIAKRLDRMKASEARADSRFIKYDRSA